MDPVLFTIDQSYIYGDAEILAVVMSLRFAGDEVLLSYKYDAEATPRLWAAYQIDKDLAPITQDFKKILAQAIRALFRGVKVQ